MVLKKIFKLTKLNFKYLEDLLKGNEIYFDDTTLMQLIGSQHFVQYQASINHLRKKKEATSELLMMLENYIEIIKENLYPCIYGGRISLLREGVFGYISKEKWQEINQLESLVYKRMKDKTI